jgi:hypothetical protein
VFGQNDAVTTSPAGSYPQQIKGVYNTGGGPHFGSAFTIDTAAELFGGSIAKARRDCLGA